MNMATMQMYCPSLKENVMATITEGKQVASKGGSLRNIIYGVFEGKKCLPKTVKAEVFAQHGFGAESFCADCKSAEGHGCGCGTKNAETFDAESLDDKGSLRVWAKDKEKDHLGYFVSKHKDGWETWKGLCGITTDKGVSRGSVISNFDGSFGRRCRKCLTAYKKMGAETFEAEDMKCAACGTWEAAHKMDITTTAMCHRCVGKKAESFNAETFEAEGKVGKNKWLQAIYDAIYDENDPAYKIMYQQQGQYGYPISTSSSLIEISMTQKALADGKKPPTERQVKNGMLKSINEASGKKMNPKGAKDYGSTTKASYEYNGKRFFVRYTVKKPLRGSKEPYELVINGEEYFENPMTHIPNDDYLLEYGAESFEAYDESITERQEYKIASLGGKIDSPMDRSDASDYIKELMGKKSGTWKEAESSPSSFDISWEDAQGVSSPSLPPEGIHFAEGADVSDYKLNGEGCEYCAEERELNAEGFCSECSRHAEEFASRSYEDAFFTETVSEMAAEKVSRNGKLALSLTALGIGVAMALGSDKITSLLDGLNRK